MTSGVFSTCPISQIIIVRENRFRQDLGDIQNLADSINRHGVMHPPIVTRDFVLVSGERRITAMQSLGWDSTPYQFSDEVSEADLIRMELEENIKREDMEWFDFVRGVEAIHKLEISEDPKWTLEKTAASIGISLKHLNSLMSVARSLDDSDVTRQTTITGAIRTVEIKAQHKAAAEMAEFMSDTYGQRHNGVDQLIHCIRFEDWVSSYAGSRFNFIHCDFPYGIDFNKMGEQAGVDYGRYKDDTATNEKLIRIFLDNIDKFAEESCHIIFWFSMQNYTSTYEALSTKFSVDHTPLVWLKSDNTGILPDPARGPRRIYETAFFGRRGDRKILRPKANAIAYPSNGIIHPHEKPQEMLEFFFNMVVGEYTSLFDPTCGSGSALRAAKKLGAVRIFGLESNEHFANMANNELNGSNVK